MSEPTFVIVNPGRLAESLRINNTRVELTYSLVDEHGYLGTRIELAYSGVDEQGCCRFCLLHEKTTLGAIISYSLAFSSNKKKLNDNILTYITYKLFLTFSA